MALLIICILKNLVKEIYYNIFEERNKNYLKLLLFDINNITNGKLGNFFSLKWLEILNKQCDYFQNT